MGVHGRGTFKEDRKAEWDPAHDSAAKRSAEEDDSGMPIARVQTRILGSWDPRILGFWNPGILDPGSWISGILGSWDPGSWILDF